MKKEFGGPPFYQDTIFWGTRTFLEEHLLGWGKHQYKITPIKTSFFGPGAMRIFGARNRILGREKSPLISHQTDLPQKFGRVSPFQRGGKQIRFVSQTNAPFLAERRLKNTGVTS